MSQLLFSNNASSTLAAPISSGSVTVNLTAGTGALFPNPSAGQYFVMTFTDAATGLLNEIVWVTARSGDTLTVTRAQEGTIAQSWAANDFAQNLWTAGQASTMESLSSGYPNIAVYQIVGGVQQVSVNGAAYTTVGAGTFAFPTSGAALVEMKGGGGSGGSTGTTTGQAAAGGGEGAKVITLLTGQVGSVSVVVGLGGASPAGAGTGNGTNGNNGTDTTFGSSLTAGKGFGGGGAGTQPPGATGGTGGAASGGVINEPGGYGMDGYFIGGSGAGEGAGVGRQTAVVSLDGQGFGSGGGGAYNAASVRGGKGANGYVIVRY